MHNSGLVVRLYLQHEHSGEHINSRDANTIADTVRQRLRHLLPQPQDKPKVRHWSCQVYIDLNG